MKRINKQFTLIVILTVGFFSKGMGQNTLSLQEAITVSLQNNFQIQIAKLQTAQSEINNSWGEAGRYPMLNITGTQGNSLSDQSQNPTSFIQELLLSNSLQGGVNLDWTLFNGFQVKANKARLEQVAAQSAGNEAVVIENTVQAVILGYYNVQLQQDKLEYFVLVV